MPHGEVLVEQRLWVRLVGGGFLLYLGYHNFRAQPAARAADSATSGLPLAGAYSPRWCSR